MSASPEVPVAWTPGDEGALTVWAQARIGTMGDAHDRAALFAREILRLRAENERLTKHVEWLRENARAMDWHGGLLRAEAIRAATRERETPTTDLAEEYWCGCTRKASWIRCDAHEDYEHDEEPPLQAKTVRRSRVSDNGE
jgi:hypothetical protein